LSYILTPVLQVVVVIPEVPGFAGNVRNDLSLKTIMAAQYRTINRGGNSIYEEIRKAGFEPWGKFVFFRCDAIEFRYCSMDYIRFYHLRSYDRINAPYGMALILLSIWVFNSFTDSFISKMEAHSGVKFEEAQVALARQWIGNQANEGGKDSIEEVYIQVPQPTTEGITQTQAGNTKTEKFRLSANEEQARQVIERFEHGADAVRGDEDVADTVSQHRLVDKTRLLDEKWLGTAQEEKDA
jgi:phospholipase D1/2